MTQSKQILHDDKVDGRKKLKTIDHGLGSGQKLVTTRMLMRGLFALANLLVATLLWAHCYH